MELSVIIVSYKVKNLLRLCLESVLMAAGRTESEIIVVDNNSADGSKEMIIKHYPEVTLISNSDNPGFSVACNQGIRASAGKFLLILNPDTVVPAEGIDKCLAFMEEHADAGALGVKLTGRDGKFLPESKRGIPWPLTAFFRFTLIYRIFPNSPFFNRYYMGHIEEDETAVVDAVTGAFLFMRHKAACKSGFFDERYFMFGEDIDLCLQMKQNGYNVYYFPEVEVTHFKGCSGAMYSYRGLGYFYRSMHLFTEKNLRGKYFFPLRALIHTGIFLITFLSFICRTPAILIRKLL